MRLFELEKRPTVAGKAKIGYSPTHGVPIRNGKNITIPSNPGLELFPLQEGWSQFLVASQDENRVWFGGTDENPFLVEMRREAFKLFLTSGTQGFYDSLIPEVMRTLQDRFQKPWSRQGDVFAYPLPFSWEELDKAFHICHGDGIKVEEVERTKRRQVFGTRHLFWGKLVPGHVDLLGLDQLTVVEGKIEAPDHSPVTLVGPHVLAQTRLLYNSQEAD